MMQNRKNTIGLVSVIIPIYNVEKYLNRCIDSLIEQTYSDLEIILVDDGSTDTCGEICDEYTKIDKRVKTLHKKNGGLSDARNLGLDSAKGDYIHFVDSDDFVAVDAIELLACSIYDYGADIATFSHVKYYREDANIHDYDTLSNKQSSLSRIDALSSLLYQNNITNSACMKLYKRKLFDTNIRFPVGMMCEDLAITYRLFSEAEKVVINTASKYFYYQREGSTMRSKFKINRMDGLYHANDQLKFINSKHPELNLAAQSRLFAEAIYILIEMPFYSKIYRKEHTSLSYVIHKYKKNILLDKKSSKFIRLGAFLSFLGLTPMLIFYKSRKMLVSYIRYVVN